LRWGVKDQTDAKEKPAWWIKTAKGDEVKYKADHFSFSVAGKLVFEESALRDWWQKLHAQKEQDTQSDESTVKGTCLVTGAEDVPIARTHFPKIEIGFKDTPPGGAAIVSFEKSSPAFSSFGFVQSYNAPVSMTAATAYCEALRHLLKSKNHSLRIGKTIVCFWARNSEEATDVFAWAFDQPKPEIVRDFLNAPRTGMQRSLSEPDDFYSITLSGNSGRVVVRHWMQMPIENAVINLQRWFTDLDIVTYGYSSDVAITKRKAKKADDADNDNGATAKSGKEATPPLGLYNFIARRSKVQPLRSACSNPY
jgi:CRISPR-associated protein Csd1